MSKFINRNYTNHSLFHYSMKSPVLKYSFYWKGEVNKKEKVTISKMILRIFFKKIEIKINNTDSLERKKRKR